MRVKAAMEEYRYCRSYMCRRLALRYALIILWA
jgi:hypothetical protein